MEALTIRAALGAGWKAASRGAWLAPVGMLVGLVRGLLFFPAAGVAIWLMARGAAAGIARRGAFPEAALDGAMTVASSPRFLAIVIGLGLSGLLLGAVLRVAYLSGTLPTLGRELVETSGPVPEFAAGLLWRFPRVAGTALLVFFLELAGTGFGFTLAGSTLIFAIRPPEAMAFPITAALAALGFTLALSVPFALSVMGDAAMARAALRDEPPAQAVARALIRFVRRPGTLLLAAMLMAAAGVMLTGSLHTVANLMVGLSASGDSLFLLGPELMIMAMISTLAALLELWRLATIAVLTCGD